MKNKERIARIKEICELTTIPADEKLICIRGVLPKQRYSAKLFAELHKEHKQDCPYY